MKTNFNPSSSKAYRRIGKICFIVVLSILIGSYFNAYFSETYEQNKKIGKSDEVFQGQKEHIDNPAKAGDPLWADILFVFAVLSLSFAFYELCGVTLGWCLRRICDVLFAGSHAGGKDEMYPPGIAIPPKLKVRVERELKPIEKIRWIGQPVPRYFTPKAKGYFLFGIPWTAFILIWTLGALTSWWDERDGGSAMMAVFGIPFILIGLGLLTSPIRAYRRALKTVYIITDRRAITFEGGRSTIINSYHSEKLQNVYRKENQDGTGDVIISRREWEDSEGQYRVEELGFLHIRGPQEAERILKKLAGQKNEGDHPFNRELRN